MVEALIAAGSSIIVGAFTLIGVMITSSRANAKIQAEMKTTLAVMCEQIGELTREVRAHNDFAVRIPILEEQIKSLMSRIKELESFHKHP